MIGIDLILYLMAAVCIYAGMYHFVFYLRRRKDNINLLFSILCLGHMGYFISQGRWYASASHLQAFVSIQYAYSFMALTMIILFWFVYFYTEKMIPLFICKASTVFFGCFSLLSFIPGRFTLNENMFFIKKVRLFNLSETVVHEFIPGALFDIYLLFAFIEIVYLCYIIIQYYTKAYGGILKPMPVAFILAVLAAVHDIIALEGMVETVYMSEFAYMVLILSMAYKLTNIFIDAMDEAEYLNAPLEALVRKRTKELEDKNFELQVLSCTDQLTRIFNRRHIEESLSKEIQKSNRYNNPLSVILLDIDHFKSINDTYGHDIGDLVLIGIAETLTENIRITDMVGRWGGEEFIVVCPQTDGEFCRVLAERIRSKVENRNFHCIGCVTASFGITQLKQGDTVNTLIKRSDTCLYEAKNSGRNMVVAATA